MQWKIAKITLRSGLQWKCSDPLLAFNDCRKCRESAVGFGTQRKPALFAVKKFVVYYYILYCENMPDVWCFSSLWSHKIWRDCLISMNVVLKWWLILKLNARFTLIHIKIRPIWIRIILYLWNLKIVK